jgi:2-haloacid dehalogenase
MKHRVEDDLNIGAQATPVKEGPNMKLGRRELLQLTSGALAATGLIACGAPSFASTKVKAIAFDAFPIFDSRPIFSLAEELYPGHGAELSNEWRTRQFEYAWLRTLEGQYADFWTVTQNALTFATRNLGIVRDEEKLSRLMNAYLDLKPWPDVVPALKRLKDAGVRLGLLSNFTDRMMTSCIAASALDGLFEQVLSTDRVKAFKPDPRAYEMGVKSFGLRREDIVFAAFAGWDAAGAKAFGYPTFWVNRLNVTSEELGVVPDGTGRTLGELLSFVLA